MTEKEKMLEQLNGLLAKRTWEIIALCVNGALMFANIFICAALTGWRDTAEFNQRDWVVFGVLMTLEAAVTVSLFVVANSFGKRRRAIRRLHYELRDMAIENSPLPSGNPIGVYTNYVYRLTVFSYPNSEEVYYIVEIVNKAYEVQTYFTSEVYPSAENLSPMLAELTNITHLFFEQTVSDQ